MALDYMGSEAWNQLWPVETPPQSYMRNAKHDIINNMHAILPKKLAREFEKYDYKKQACKKKRKQVVDACTCKG